MKVRQPEGLKVPTAAQIRKRAEELLAEDERREREAKISQRESRAMAELSEELNRGRIDSSATDQARDAGMTFVRDVWPDHPAADHLIGVQAGSYQAARPCGVRHPFRLAEDGVWFCDYWVASPIFPAGRTESGAVVVAFLTDAGWRYATPTPPVRAMVGDSVAGGFETLRSLGLRMNPAPLRGAPEVDTEMFDVATRTATDGKLRSSDDLLWRFVNATQNESPWEVPAA